LRALTPVRFSRRGAIQGDLERVAAAARETLRRERLVDDAVT